VSETVEVEWHDVATENPSPLGMLVFLAFGPSDDPHVVFARRVEQGVHTEWRGCDDALFEGPLAWAFIPVPGQPVRTVRWVSRCEDRE
jgi:hypothetical protein